MEVVLTKSKKKDKKYDAIIDGKKPLVLDRLAHLISLNTKMLKEKIDT